MTLIFWVLFTSSPQKIINKTKYIGQVPENIILLKALVAIGFEINILILSELMVFKKNK